MADAIVADVGEIQQEMYIPVRTLGRGAFGEAVLYRKIEDNMLVVWKEVNLSKASEKERVDALKEIDILSLLNHPNVVTYFNHFIDGTSLFIEMEYCNGGTLHDKINLQTDLLAEEIVIWYFYQICSAIQHIHENDIVHRDIKTMNIFLTKSGLVKLGDFGISKILDSEGMADSIVGTPYYMSPEIVQGKKYNQKSDMWALGCVLYEVLTLKRVFDATNPLRLVAEIVKGQYEEIDSRYTEDMNDMVNTLLSKNPDDRPTIQELLEMPILAVLGKEMDKKVWQLNASTRRARLATASSETVEPVITSKLTEVFFWGAGKQIPQKIDTFVRGNSALQVSAGHSHFAVVTVEKEVFTWANAHGGKEMSGQLGHGDIGCYRLPKKVETFHGVPIRQVACGDEFTACLTEENVLYMFGSDYYGCIGCNGELGDDVLSPYKVAFFADKPVKQVSCGDCHVVALTDKNELYSWGCGEHGRLGLGSEDDHALPQKIQLPKACRVKRVYCGPEGTFLLNVTGRVLAFGNNDENQLGLDTLHRLKKRTSQGGHVSSASTPTVVQSLSRYTVASIAPGKSHTAIIDVYGRLVTVGSNKYGQLGVNDFQRHHSPCLVKGELISKQVVAAACGDEFTVVATAENMVYAWGRGDNGRLGLTPDNLFKKRSSVPCSAVPRPVFGALHSVTSIDCRYWNSIIVAEKVLNSRTIRSALSRSLDSQSSTEDSVFSDRMRIEVDSLDDDMGHMIDDNRHMQAPMGGTADSGVGPSPRSPIPRTLGDTSQPPPWLQDELDQADYISIDSNSIGSSNKSSSSPLPPSSSSVSSSAVPSWLRKELVEAEYIPMDDSSTSNIRSTSLSLTNVTRDGPLMTSVGIQYDISHFTLDDVSEGKGQSGLLQRILQLETENKQLRSTIQEQVVQIKSLQHENRDVTEKHNKLWELIDDWHKDCQSVHTKHSRPAPRRMPATPTLSDPSDIRRTRSSSTLSANEGSTERVGQDHPPEPPKKQVTGVSNESWEV